MVARKSRQYKTVHRGDFRPVPSFPGRGARALSLSLSLRLSLSPPGSLFLSVFLSLSFFLAAAGPGQLPGGLQGRRRRRGGRGGSGGGSEPESGRRSLAGRSLLALAPCVSLFYVNDIGSTGSRGIQKFPSSSSSLCIPSTLTPTLVHVGQFSVGHACTGC